MSYIYYNPNPEGHLVGDCVVRALCKAFDSTWDQVYLELMAVGYRMKDMPSSNNVWATLLKQNDYTMKLLPNTCPDCVTIHSFCKYYPEGEYILATGTHVVAVQDGNYFDAWDSGSEVVSYIFQKG